MLRALSLHERRGQAPQFGAKQLDQLSGGLRTVSEFDAASIRFLFVLHPVKKNGDR
jgi:hypothetical protein